MTDRETKIENVFLRAYVDELLKEVPDNKKKTYRLDWRNGCYRVIAYQHQRSPEKCLCIIKFLLLRKKACRRQER